MKLPNWVLPFSAVLLCAGCALMQSPAEQGLAFAEDAGFRVVEVPDRRLRAFAKTPVSARRVTVYIESDGAPWLTSDTPPKDPTPLKPFVLRMASADPSAAVAYLGRPCQYLDAQELKQCDPALWIQGRLREEAVAAMSTAVGRLKQLYGATEVNLVGYSGGGAMAALIAARRTDVSCLVTVAAPLDTTAWTAAVGVSALAYSLNPADATDKLKAVRQTHFRGLRDRIVPAASTRTMLSRLPDANVIDKASFDHECCWDDEWRELRKQSCLDK